MPPKSKAHSTASAAPKKARRAPSRKDAPKPAPPAAPASAEKSALVVAGQAAAAEMPLAIPGQPRITLCMIVKNEENHLPLCLKSVADLVHEIIVLDTGSTDRTKEIATRLGARVFEAPWADSFAAARNESLRHATGDWIFWMDADDRLNEENRAKLRSLFATLPAKNIAYLMRCMIVPAEGSTDTLRVVDHTRLFRNHAKIRWHYRVHEQILPAVYSMGGEVRRSEVVVQHVGYQDASLRPQKIERNLRLLQFDNAEGPDDPFTLYNIGRALERLGRIPEAVPYWRRSLQLVPAHETYVSKLYALLADAYHQAGQRGEMMRICLAGLARFPEYGELLFRVGCFLYELRDYTAAAACLERLLATTPAHRQFALGDDVGIHYKARTMLGRVYRDQKRPADAEAQWRAALAEAPAFGQALLGLGQVLLDRGAWEELESVIARLEARPEGEMEAAVLRGLRHVVRKEIPQARALMEQSVEKYPKAIEPRILLSRILLRDRNDLAAAEKTLQGILALEPNNAEAKRALAQLLPVKLAPGGV